MQNYYLHSNLFILILSVFEWVNLPESNLHSNLFILIPRNKQVYYIVQLKFTF